jgi:N-acetylglucosamine-6-phosphate deacetylase
MTALAAARVITPERVYEPGVIDVDGATIVDVAPTSGPVPSRTLVPGFIDLQVNGIADVDVAHARDADWERLDDHLIAQGVTSWVPTLVTAPLADFVAPLERLAAAAARPGPRPAIAGAHLEGPFLGELHGAHPSDLVLPVDLTWLAALPGTVAVVTLGPEQENALEAIRLLSARNVLVALGHSAASLEIARAATDAGARLVTHCFNGMPSLHHRAPGLIGAALSDDRLSISLIADLVHVHPTALTIAFRAKGRERVALVTDAVAWQAGEVGGIALHYDGQAPRLADGTLAGSALTMDQAVRNLVHDAAVELADAVYAAATTPARLLRLDDRGGLVPGARADIVALDDRLHVEAVWIGGERVK